MSLSPYYTDEAGTTLYHGDCVDVLAALPEASVDTVITDPPYHLTQASRGGSPRQNDPATPHGRTRLGSAGFMGKTWDGGDVAFRPETWAAVLRVCKPGAMLLAFGGTRTFHRLTCAIEDAGWEIRDCLSWLYGSGFPKSHDISKAIDKAAGAHREVIGSNPNHRAPATDHHERWNSAVLSPNVTAPATASAKLWNGWGTALKPAWEPIILAMKPLDGTFAENAQEHGVAGLNIDGGRIPGAVDDGRDFTASPLHAGHAGNTNVYGTATLRTYEPSAQGRFPANVLLDGPAAELLDEQTGELGLSSGTEVGTFKGWTKTTGDRVKSVGFGDSGGASRFFYTAKASRSDRGHGNDHPTVKPTDLLKYLCKLTATPTGGVVLDPFAGSGTTLVAAREFGRPCIGIELERGHCQIAVDRLRQSVLFGAGGAA